MADIQELLVRFKADVRDFNNKVDQVEKSLNEVSKDANNLGKNISASANMGTKSFGGLAVGVSSATNAILLATAAVGTFSVTVGSQMESATARIASMVGGLENANIVLSALRDAGSETGASILSLADSYSKMASFVENGSLTLQESIDLTKGLSDASIALGASSDQLGYVIYGLSQALGSGIVRAEEFNQVMEPLPALLNRIEKENGLVSGSLRQMVNDGKLTSEQFKNYLIPALQSFEEQAHKMANTLTVQSGKVKNSLTAIGEDIYDQINTPLAQGLALLDDFLQRLTSTKRATTEELQRRLNEVMNSRAIAFDRGQGVGIQAEASRKRVTELTKEENDIIAELKSRQQSLKDAQKDEERVRLENQKKTNARLAMEAKKQAEKDAKKKPKKTDEEKEAERQAEIRSNAIASAKEAIAVAQAETESARKLEYSKKALAEARKLEAVGVGQNTKEYKELVRGLEEAFKAQQMMQEKLDTEAYVRQKNRENEALADYQQVLGMTSIELEKYNIQKALQADLEEKSLTMTKEGFEEYKKQAEAIAERTQAIIEQNKAFEDSVQGGFLQIMTDLRENAITDADIIKGAFDSMSSNITDTFVAFTTTGKASFKDMAVSIIQDINKIIMRAIVMQAITGIVNSVGGSFFGGDTGGGTSTGNLTSSGDFTFANTGTSFGGYKAKGGNVYAGKSYMVGENGREMFTPTQNGTITPNGGMGGGVSVSYNIDARGADPQSASNIKRAMEQTKRETIIEVQAMMRGNTSMTKAVRSIR